MLGFDPIGRQTQTAPESTVSVQLSTACSGRNTDGLYLLRS